MRHALILQALRLPLIASLCICTGLVAIAAWPEFASDAAETAPDDGSASARSDAADTTSAVRAMPEDEPVVSLPVREDQDDSGGADDDRGEGVSQLLTTVASDSRRSSPSTSPSPILEFETLIASLHTGKGSAIQSRLQDRFPTVTRFVAEWDVQAAHAAAGEAVSPHAARLPGTTTVEEPQDEATEESAGELVKQRSAPIYLRNPVENRLKVSFLLDGRLVELPPGEQTLIGTAAATVVFDRGGGLGAQTEALAEGGYEFQLKSTGWELRPVLD